MFVPVTPNKGKNLNIVRLEKLDAAAAECPNTLPQGDQPFVPPEPLPVIDEDEVQLVCWMTIETNARPIA